jgi:hypothetical protein
VCKMAFAHATQYIGFPESLHFLCQSEKILRISAIWLIFCVCFSVEAKETANCHFKIRRNSHESSKGNH